MKNPYVNRMMQAAHKFLEADKAHKTAIDELETKRKDGLLAPVDYTAGMGALNEQAQQNASVLTEALESILGEYTEAVSEWSKLRGENMTPDMALLTSPIQLSKADLVSLAERHVHNATMQRALMDYAQAHETPFIPLPTLEKKIEAMTRIAEEIARVQHGGYAAAVIQKESAMAGFFGGFEGVIGDSSEMAAST